MPRRIPYRLQWSSEAVGYTLLKDGRPVVPPLELFGQSWLMWLESTSSFSFQARSGEDCTVRKETVQRGGTYWYAYRRQDQRMVKRYLARGTDLTLARLEIVAAELNRSSLSGLDDAATLHTADGGQENVNGSPLEEIVSSPLLLATRLHIPRLPLKYVPRPRLLELLQQGIQGSLTLISAPAGSGKTTLLAELASSTPLPVAWITLETADNDPLRFLSYFIAALANLDASLDTAMQAYRLTDARNIENVLTSIINDLTSLLHREVIVILDDYHLLSSDTIHTLWNFLLDHLPSSVHLVIGTRVDPPLSLARLRARGQMLEVRAEDLRFTSAEVEALVHTMGLALSSEATDLLERRTEGWVAGIQLLTLALRGQPDAMAFLQAFRGTHRFFLDYIGEEILARQTPAMQHFLLLTSILEHMTGALCDAVMELPGGQTRLEELLRANLFVSALDDTGTWYRYHPLFADALRAHLRKREPELVPQLYLRASRWYERNQSMEEACDAAFLSGDLSRAADLVALQLPHLIEQGRIERLKSWLSQLPQELIIASPQLYITMPWLNLVGRHSPEISEHMLAHMEQYVQEQQRDTSVSWVEPQSVLTLFRALSVLSENNPQRAFTLAREALRVLANRETELSQLLVRLLQIILSLTYGARGDLVSAEQTLLSLSRAYSNQQPSLINLTAMLLLGELYRAKGHLHQLGGLYGRVAALGEVSPDYPALPRLQMGFLLMRRASLLHEWNLLPEAAAGLRKVMDMLQYAVPKVVPQPNQGPLLLLGLWMQARTELAQGRPDAALHLLELVRTHPELCGEISSSREQSMLDVPMLVARLALYCDQLAEAERWERTCGLYYDDTPATLLESRQLFAYLTLARLLIVRGRTRRTGTDLAQALILLDHWRDCVVNLGFQGWFIEVQMLTALALHAQGNTRQALTTLGGVLSQSEREGYIRLFADEGQPMADLLLQVAAYTTASSVYIQRIQAAMAPQTQTLALPDRDRREAPPTLIEPLSVREMEVLTLMETGASNQQIADRLVISPLTVKQHVKHILAKLAATNRTQAVMRARELELL